MSRWIIGVAMAAALLVAGCSGRFESSYPEAVDPAVSRGWTVRAVDTVVPDSLRLNESNTLAPEADIVWHGEPAGDRRAQVAAIVTEGVTRGAAPLNGSRPVGIRIELQRFHGVTPVAVERSPSAVHSIAYRVWVFDTRDGTTILGPMPIRADLLANTRANAITATTGRSERARIVDHIAAVTAGWLGIAPDPRGSFVSIGR
jgi:hypothetical protein